MDTHCACSTNGQQALCTYLSTSVRSSLGLDDVLKLHQKAQPMADRIAHCKSCATDLHCILNLVQLLCKICVSLETAFASSYSGFKAGNTVHVNSDSRSLGITMNSGMQKPATERAPGLEDVKSSVTVGRMTLAREEAYLVATTLIKHALSSTSSTLRKIQANLFKFLENEHAVGNHIRQQDEIITTIIERVYAVIAQMSVI